MTRPIDTIRTKMDSDLTKYHGASLCKIAADTDIKNLRGIGLCAIVAPVNKYNDSDPDTLGEDNSFPVLIINRPGKWLENNISDKYYVLTLNPVTDRPRGAVGFLISKTLIQDMEVWRAGISGKEVKASDGRSLETFQEEMIGDA